MTKLSELIKDRETFEPATEEDFFVFGIEVDTDEIEPPRNVREIGLIAKTEDGELTNEVLDVTISYILAGIDVLVEFPSDVDIGDPRHLMATAASINASLSLLPPAELTDESFEAYCQRLEAVTSAYLRQLTMTKFVMPITNYLQYCFTEVLDGDKAKSFVPEDGYVLTRFHQSMTIEQSDNLKARVRKVIIDHFDGEYGFRTFALGLMGSVTGAVENSLAEIADEYSKKIPPAGWYWLLRKEDSAFIMSRFDGVATWHVEQPDGALAPIATSEAGRDHVLIEAALSPAERHQKESAAIGETETADEQADGAVPQADVEADVPAVPEPEQA
ncbi:hypothetical protein G6L37_02310 [Agrobacterium rubi]|nr:hypothetical protein [Agrobacterium rubi]NTF24228.1 hypothetical protein [Agrobacterium rubi]